MSGLWTGLLQPGPVVRIYRALEQLACECYRIISGEYRRLLGPDAR